MKEKRKKKKIFFGGLTWHSEPCIEILFYFRVEFCFRNLEFLFFWVKKKKTFEFLQDEIKPLTLGFLILRFLAGYRVTCKVRQLGGKNGQFRHNRASNAGLGMKILQKGKTWTKTSFSTNFSGKLSFILCFLFPATAGYIFFSLLLPVQLL